MDSIALDPMLAIAMHHVRRVWPEVPEEEVRLVIEGAISRTGTLRELNDDIIAAMNGKYGHRI